MGPKASGGDPKAGFKKIHRAFLAASGRHGEYVDRERLAATLLAYSLTLTDRPDNYDEVMSAAETEAEAATADGAPELTRKAGVGISTAANVALAMREIGQLTKAMKKMGTHKFMSATEEEVLAVAATD